MMVGAAEPRAAQASFSCCARKRRGKLLLLEEFSRKRVPDSRNALKHPSCVELMV